MTHSRPARRGGRGGRRARAPASEAAPSLWDAAACAERLPAGTYALARGSAAPRRPRNLRSDGCWAAIASPATAASPSPPTRSAWSCPRAAIANYAQAAAAAIGWSRDLVNTPANELGPAELAAAAAGLAREFGGQCTLTEGEALRREYPLVHAVGQASARAPRLIDCRWPRAGAPRVTLVGKGVCFDSRRARPEALGGHAADEKRHGRRRLCAGAGAPAADHAGAGATAADHPGGREQRRRSRLPAGRRVDLAQGPDGRDRQYRRRRPPGAGRRAEPMPTPSSPTC